MDTRKNEEQNTGGRKLYRVFTAIALIREKPEDAQAIGRRDSELLFGELFSGESEKDGWVYGEADGYRGYVKKRDLKPEAQVPPPTHFTDTPWTHIYPAPSFKTRPAMGLPMLARLAVDETQEQDGFVAAPGLGWIFKAHVQPLARMKDADPVDTALRFLGAPYLYGGRSAQGMDCSKLVQLALTRAGLPCPHDSDQQENAVGAAVTDGTLKRGDLVYFPGHVGMMIDGKSMINATARHMKVVIEPVEKVKAANKPITAVRRLAP
jgi:cell wall-associated NlpC family hydrolase